MKKFLLTLMAAVLVSGMTMAAEKAEENAFKGRVVESVDGKVKPVQFAYVYCEGTTISTYTNEKGEFELPVEKAGKYTLRFSHAGYKVVEKKVKVKKHASTVECEINKEEVLLTAL